MGLLCRFDFGNLIEKADIDIFKIMMVAVKNVITKKWLKRVTEWMEIMAEIYEMEKCCKKN